LAACRRASALVKWRLMNRRVIWLLIFAFAHPALALERQFDFSATPVNQTPSNCVSTVAGAGKPGSWKVILDDFAPALQPLSPNAPAAYKKAVVAQLAEDFGDEHFPMLILGNDNYGDFTFTTKFKIVSGVMEQMAGVAFRMQNEKNYYVVRASALGKNFRFYKVVNGQRGTLIGPEIDIPKGVWHQLTIECKGNQIRCLLDGNEAIPPLTDNSFSTGRIAFWTKSDSVSYFADTRLTYVQHESFVQELVHDAMLRNSHVLGLKVFMKARNSKDLRLVACDNLKEIGQPGTKTDADVLERGTYYVDKSQKTDAVTTTLPLYDRNGEIVAAVRVKMKTFRGQTEENAIIRAMPVVKEMEKQVPAVDDLTD
jgi:hypothetical protein